MNIFAIKIFMVKEITCSKCNIVKPLSNFHKDRQKISGYRQECKKCSYEVQKKYVQNNREKINFNNKKYVTGLSREEYLNILKNQDYSCAICGKTEKENRKSLSVDHCHNTKLIRGLLCASCNFAIGYFKDSEILLSKAILYLRNNMSDKGLIFKEWKQKEKLSL